MAKTKALEPTLLQVIRRGKTFKYELADKLDWSILFENTVLEIKEIGGKTHYWPLDSVTQWITSPCQQINHA